VARPPCSTSAACASSAIPPSTRPVPRGYLTKTVGPAVTEDELGPVDLVLVSHDNHPDNLDDRGRALALAAPLVLTTGSGEPGFGWMPVQVARGLDGEQRARLLPDLPDVNECHLVI
jgi:L-ascorbate metabolism protein UlaG (beta-lactamase superfamily)